MPTAAELLFKIQASGTDELKKVESVVKSVGEGTRLAGAQLKTFDSTLQSLVSTGKTYRQALEEMARANGVLSQSIRSTASELLLQIKAAEGDAEAIRKLAGAHHELVGQAAAASCAIRVFEGNMPIRAVEGFAAKVLGLGPLLQAAFPIIGAIAFGEMLFHLWEKTDPLIKAEKELAETTKRVDSEFERLEKRFESLQIEEVTAKLGKLAGMRLAAFYADSDRAQDQARINYLNQQIQKKQADLDTGREGSPFPGVIGAFLGQRSEQAARDKISEMEQERDLLQFKIKVDDQQHKTDDAKGAEEGRKQGQELAKRQAQELINLQHQLAEVQSRELTGVDAINAKRDATIEKLREEHLLTKEILDVINQIAIAEAKVGFQKALERGQKEAAHGAAEAVKSYDSDENRSDRFAGRQFLENLRKQIEQDTKDVASMLRVINRGDQSDADAVQRALQVTVSGNDRAARSGSISGGTAAGNDLQARVAAAQQIFAIETRHLDLIDDKDKREEKLAEARKKYADEVYAAEAKYEEDLEALREKDLQKYENLAGKLFDAITNRSRGAGYEIGQMLRGAAVSTGRQIFTNIFSHPLQTAGHTVAGATGGSTFGGLLKGTIFDPANKGADSDGTQSKIEDHTQKSVEWLNKIYNVLSGDTTSTDPSAANPASSPAGIAAGVGGSSVTAATASLGGSGSTSPLGGLLKLLGVSNAAFGNFGAGLSSVVSGNALSILLGQNTTGPTTLSGQIGAGVGLAGSLALGGLGIASGISQGGVGGDLKAAGSAAAVTGAIVSNVSKLLGAASPALAAAGPIGAIAGAVLPLIGSLFSTGPQKRQLQISQELAQNQYLAPTALNVMQGENGTYEDFDARGNLRTSNLSAVPTVAEPFIWQQTHGWLGGPPTYYDVPGGVTSPYSGSATGSGAAPVSNAGGQTIVIQAMDPQSFHDYLQKPANAAAVGNAVNSHLMSGGGEKLASTIAYHVNP